MHLVAQLKRFCALSIIGLSASVCAWAADVGIMDCSLSRAQNGQSPGLYLTLSVEFDLPSGVEEVLVRGVPLYFVTDFTLQRQRWYWFDKDVSQTKLTTRLSYSPLSRQYRLSRGGLGLSFDNLRDALAAMKVIADWKVSNRSSLSDPADYDAEVRFRLDIEQLPLPMQISIGTNDWDMSSGWYAIPLDSRVTEAQE